MGRTQRGAARKLVGSRVAMTDPESDRGVSGIHPNRLAGLSPPPGRSDFRWTLGTRPVAAQAWLDVSAATNELMAEKSALFEESLDEVVLSLPGSHAAGVELLELVLNHLRSTAPERFEISATEIRDRDRRVSTSLIESSAIDVVGRLVAEDFCVLEPIGGSWVLTSASVCFPSRWRPRDKLGQDLSGIHQPVPEYEGRIGSAVHAVFDKLTPERILGRSNWTLLDTNQRHLLTVGQDSSDMSSPTQIADLGWLRVERQTFRKLPASGAVVFTILTQLTALDELDHAERDTLIGAVFRAPRGIADYKSWPTTNGQTRD